MQESIYDPGFAPFGGGSTASTIHPVVLGVVGLIAVLTFTLKRKYAIVPLLLGMLLIPYGQNWYIGGVPLYVFRLLIILAWIRVGISRVSLSPRVLPRGFTVLGKLFLVWGCYRALGTNLFFGEVA